MGPAIVLALILGVIGYCALRLVRRRRARVVPGHVGGRRGLDDLQRSELALAARRQTHVAGISATGLATLAQRRGDLAAVRGRWRDARRHRDGAALAQIRDRFDVEPRRRQPRRRRGLILVDNYIPQTLSRLPRQTVAQAGTLALLTLIGGIAQWKLWLATPAQQPPQSKPKADEPTRWRCEGSRRDAETQRNAKKNAFCLAGLFFFFSSSPAPLRLCVSLFFIHQEARVSFPLMNAGENPYRTERACGSLSSDWLDVGRAAQSPGGSPLASRHRRARGFGQDHAAGRPSATPARPRIFDGHALAQPPEPPARLDAP